MKYWPLEELIIAGDKLPPPLDLDCLEFAFQGITMRVYGILHGITGGHNREYYQFVIDSINHVQGLKVCEKGMSLLYRRCTFDYELDDWLVLKPSDSLLMGMQLTLDPRCLWMIIIDPLRELLLKSDPYPLTQTILAALNESRYFHYLDPSQRRTNPHGHLPSDRALKKDLAILSSSWVKNILSKSTNLIFYNPIYKRMMLLERFMHIPARSIHMLFYAHGLARQSGVERVNVFVGETHNTDMQYLAMNMESFIIILNDKEKTVFHKIKNRAAIFSRSKDSRTAALFRVLRLRYFATLFLGASLPILLYIFAAAMLFN